MDMSSSMWKYYVFKRIQDESEVEKMHKSSETKIREVKPPAIDLEEFRVENSRAIVTIKNTDTRPATVFGINLWKVLDRPIIESRFFGEEIWMSKRINRSSDPETFTIPPSETTTIEISLSEPLDGLEYVLEFYMGKHEEYVKSLGGVISYRLGWAFLLILKGERIEKVASMTLKQSEVYWEKIRYRAEEWLKKYPRRGKNILLSSSILGILLLPVVLLYINVYLGIIGFVGWVLSLVGWNRAKNGKSGSIGVIGGIFMIITVACLIPGILAIIGGMMSRRPKI